MTPLSSGRSAFALRQPMIEAAGLLLVSLAIAGLSWLLRPDPLPWRADPITYELELSAPVVNVDEALRLFEEGDHLFIDTRRGAAEAPVTISGAFIIREARFDDDLLSLLDDVFPEDPLLLFGNGELSGVSNIAARLQKRGYLNLLILRVGLAGWQDAGGDVSAPIPSESEGES